MRSEEFIERAKELVKGYALEHLDKSDEIAGFKVYVVWYSFILGNQKALLSTTLLNGMYYEVTYNAEGEEIYLDAYKKFENRCVEV